MDTKIMDLINGEKDTDIELLSDTDNKICAVNYFDHLANSLDEFEDRAWNKKEGYKTPNFPSLSTGLEGWESGLYIFAGLANHGKTAIMVNILEDLVMHSENKLFGVYYSLDDDKNKVLPRIVAMRESLPIGLISKPGRYKKMVEEQHPDAINIAQLLDRRAEGIQKLKEQSNKMMVLDSQEIKSDKDLKNSIYQIYNYINNSKKLLKSISYRKVFEYKEDRVFYVAQFKTALLRFKKNYEICIENPSRI